jgi:hypothetical protein
MGDIHNLQGIIAQSPILNRLHEAPQYAAANGAQILNLTEQRKTNRKLSKVQELAEIAATEKEEVRKRRLKKAAANSLIDLTV